MRPITTRFSVTFRSLQDPTFESEAKHLHSTESRRTKNRGKNGKIGGNPLPLPHHGGNPAGTLDTLMVNDVQALSTFRQLRFMSRNRLDLNRF